MTLLELHDSVKWLLVQAKLQHLKPESVEVTLQIVNPGALSGTLTVKMESIYMGIDWDKNKCIIKPAKNLAVINKTNLAEWTKLRDKAIWDFYKKNRRILRNLK